LGTNNPASEEEQESEFSNSILKTHQLMKNLFITSKEWLVNFLYCENKEEVKEQFENILERKRLDEKCCVMKPIFFGIDDNRLTYDKPVSPKFFSCKLRKFNC
jgi:uncharacterized UPF0160 family protein